MAQDEVVIVQTKRPVWQRVALGIVGVVLALALLVGIMLLGLNTAPGKRFLVKQITALQLESGMKIDIGRIDGSIYGKMVIHDLALRDPRGVFATSPEVTVDWSPFQYIQNHINVRSVTSPLIRLARSPQFNQTPSDPNAPWLPDLDIDIDRLKIDRLELAPPVTGVRRVVAISGAAHIADGRAQINADARADSGDRLRASLDAVPDQNRLTMQGRLDAPAKGIVAAMTGIAQPLTATLDGKGSWQAWNGKLIASSHGGELANVTLAARNGTFTAKGPLRPGLVMEGPVARLTSPALALDMTAALAERRVTLRGSLRSTALAATANGLIDLANSRFGALKIDAQLLTPGAIMEKVRGRDVHANVILDGPFATPLIDYDITAAQLAFDATGIEGLRATGRAVIDADRIRFPITAQAKRVTGLNAAAGGLLQNLRVKGDFAYASGKLISDNLKIDSDKVDAIAIVLADLPNAIYRGALKGRINDYRVDGVGIVNLTTDIKIVPGAKGGFGLSGRFGVRTARLDNASVRDFLGGNALVTGRIGMTPEGTFTVAQLKGAAPSFTILSGSGSYATNGAVSFDGRATSRQYGPLAVTVRGTLDRPQAVLRAVRPNVGVQLSNVVAKLNGEASGYRLEATGGSPYGPFFANVLIRTARGPLIIDISRARFAGVDFAGTLRQSPQGPFVGRLSMNGSGIVGAVQLANVGKIQSVNITANATNAKVPGDYNIVIGRAIVNAAIMLYDTPQVVADVQLANTAYGEYVIRQARGKVNYRGGRGTAQLVANGSSGVPFTIAMNAALRPNLYAVALKGTADRVDFRLARPAIIRAERGGYRLEPAKLVLPQGSIDLAGRFGGQTALQARFKDFDLAIANIFAPGLGVGGAATGSLDFAQSGNAFPTATTRLAIANFTRSSLTAMSDPVAISMEGKLQNGSGDVRALIRRNGTAVGRALVTLGASGGGSWSEQLARGALGGGIRYNGPADVLFSFAGQADQQLTGGIALAADFSGQANDPRFNGLVRANALTYENETFGTRVTNMQMDGRFTRDQLEIRRFNGRAGDGTVQASGRVSLSAANGFPMDIRIALDRARLARSDALGTVVSGNIAVTNSQAAGALVSGDLNLPELRYQIIRQGGAEIRELTGVRRKGEALQSVNASRTTDAPPSLFKLDLRVRADNKIYVTGMGLESEWKTDMRITGTTAAPRIVGSLDVIRGTYSFSGRRFELTKGVIRFGGADLYNPTIVISASTTVEGVTAILNVTGTAQKPEIAFTSTPSLPQDEVMSRILFGSNVSNLSATQAIQLAAALNGLRGSGGGLNPLGKLQGAAGIDRLRILGADKDNGRGTALAAGQHITNNVYVEIITDARGFTATQLEVALSKALSVLSQTGGTTGTSINVRYSKDY